MSGRKSYQRPVSANWWLKRPGYRFYMLREATSVLVLAFGAELWWALRALAKGADSWERFVLLLQSPAMLVLNWLILVAACLHAVTWFQLTPKTMNLKLAGKPVANKHIEFAHYGVWLVVSVVVLLICLGVVL